MSRRIVFSGTVLLVCVVGTVAFALSGVVVPSLTFSWAGGVWSCNFLLDWWSRDQ